jgi:hypothetical protein
MSMPPEVRTPPDDGDGPWVPGFPEDSDEFRAWVDGAVPPPHHEKWNKALQLGLDFKTERWKAGQERELIVELQVFASRRNPGWIDGYRAVYRP